ncbi:MAG TPA: DNA helicase UvrD [Deltaproteobacteria bacterium]|nr:DNA helicase UvrD [Deltaproteobacteria bacterium]
MRIIADLHVHTGYSRATSREMTLENMALWAARKGIDLLGTGDFTHPAHMAAIEEKLEPAEPGLYVLSGVSGPAASVRYMLTAEVSNIYRQDGRTRKIHTLIFVPSVEAARRLNSTLAALGNIRSDGRPIFGFSARDLVKIVLDASDEAMVVPAHAWTPWFSIFGSRSGFDSIEECFGEWSPRIRAIETGLSSDPPMNRRISALDGITLISNSDAHSPSKLGREANVLDCGLDYRSVTSALSGEGPGRLLYTIEYYPEEGKYHYDGHRGCGVLYAPKRTREMEGRCLVCGAEVTVGVMSRVEELADRSEEEVAAMDVPARRLVPLQEILAEVLGRGPATKAVTKEYLRLVDEAGGEFALLLDMDRDDIEKMAGPRVAEAVSRVRSGRINVRPGFDGEFGKISIFDPLEPPLPKPPPQPTLF